MLLNYYIHSGARISKVSEEWINVDKMYMKMYKEISDRFSDNDKKQIDFSFYKRAVSYYYKLKNKKEVHINTNKMLKLYPFKFDTIKAEIKSFLINFKGE